MPKGNGPEAGKTLWAKANHARWQRLGRIVGSVERCFQAACRLNAHWDDTNVTEEKRKHFHNKTQMVELMVRRLEHAVDKEIDKLTADLLMTRVRKKMKMRAEWREEQQRRRRKRDKVFKLVEPLAKAG